MLAWRGWWARKKFAYTFRDHSAGTRCVRLGAPAPTIRINRTDNERTRMASFAVAVILDRAPGGGRVNPKLTRVSRAAAPPRR